MDVERVTGTDKFHEDTLRSEAEVVARIDAAVAQADFSPAPLPDFAAVVPEPHQLLADLAARTQLDADPSARLCDAMAELGQALNEAL